MGGKSKKTKRNSKDSGSSSEKPKKGGKPGGGKGKGKSSAKGKSSKFQGDMLSEGAMENAYLVCHNVQELLKSRGFPWPEAKKKGKKGGKKK